MRRRSSPPLQFVAAAVSDTTMASRPPYRGGRNQWRRRFSDRPSSGRDDYVTGDSHFTSVRDANLGFQQGERGDFETNSGFRPRPFSPRPPNYQNQPFTPRPHFNQNQSFNPRPHVNQNQTFNPPPHFHQNQSFRQPQTFRPRPQRPMDYRNWEYAKPGPPPQCERFIVLSYNLLADYLAINHRSRLYFHIPRYILDWEWRKRNIIFELGLWSADIMCFQEVDRFHDLEELLKLQGYSGIWKMRTGNPIDGCAIFWRASRFKLLHEEWIEFNKLGLRDNVAQICVLESARQNCTENISALPTSSTRSNKVVICNIHVLYNPGRGEIKLGQVRVLLDRAHAVSKIWNDAPIVICGDFNCTPKSPLYNFISEQKLDLSGLARDKLSGQASGEIHAHRAFSPNSRVPSADKSIQPPTMIAESEAGVKQSVPLPDMQKQDNPDSSVENVPCKDNLHQSECSKTVLDGSDKSSTDGQYGNENSAQFEEVRKKTQHDAVDGNKDETETTTPVPVDGLKESPSSSHSEGNFPDNPMDDGIYEFTPAVSSHQEAIHFVAIETEQGEKVYATSHSDHGSLSEHSQSNICAENKAVNCDMDTLSFVDDNYFTGARVNPEPVNTSKSYISSPELFCQTSLPDPVKVSSPGSSGDLSSQSVSNDEKGSPSPSYQVNISYASTNINAMVDEKIENLLVNDLDEATEGDENIGEDWNTFLSELHNTKNVFPLDYGQFVRSDLVKGCAPPT
ncbi:hypothetical protein L1049_018456 [Liquidambar formosana]|uniref:Endonuclease/exonuclease/phosphatase domain-containing protein n=1 Tax=Liquidambar formosana TaxID=63359 RepID=A0AAP0RAL7_LIQFO